jgi:hypothetical protein
MKHQFSLKKILTINFLLVAVIPILIMGLITSSIVSRNVSAEISEKNILLAETLAGEI